MKSPEMKSTTQSSDISETLTSQDTPTCRLGQKRYPNTGRNPARVDWAASHPTWHAHSEGANGCDPSLVSASRMGPAMSLKRLRAGRLVSFSCRKN